MLAEMWKRGSEGCKGPKAEYINGSNLTLTILATNKEERADNGYQGVDSDKHAEFQPTLTPCHSDIPHYLTGTINLILFCIISSGCESNVTQSINPPFLCSTIKIESF